MKLIPFRRKALIRAIQAACLAIFLAHAGAVRAQTVSGGGAAVTIAGPGTDFLYDGTTPVVLNSGGTLTLTSTAVITNTNVSSIVALSEDATITNNGTLTEDYSNDLSQASAIFSTGGSGATIINNNGTASATNTSGDAGYGIFYSGAGSVTITNAGTASGTGASGSGIYASTTGAGNVSVTNTSAGIVSSTSTSTSGNYLAINYETNTGSAYIHNQGQLIASGSAAGGILGTSSGDSTIVNSGTINATANVGDGQAYGISANSINGNMLVTNTGAITVDATGSAYGIRANSNAGTDTVSNTAAISVTSSSNGPASGMYALGSSSAFSFTNGGVISASAVTGTASGIYVVTYGTSPVAINNSGSLLATSANGDAYGMVVTTGGNITMTNSGTASGTGAGQVAGIEAYSGSFSGSGNIVITNTSSGVARGISDNDNGVVYGIFADDAQGGNIAITNQGSVNATDDYVPPIDANPGDTYAYGISAFSYDAGTIQIVNTGSATATNSGYHNYTDGIYASSRSGDVTIMNSGTAMGTGSNLTEASASGIYGESVDGNVTIMNSGSRTVSGIGTGSDYGISGYASGTGNVSIINTSTGLVSAQGSNANDDTVSGIYADSNNGSAAIMNTGSVTAVGGESYGLSAEGAAGATIVNSGAVSSTSGTGQYGYGINIEDFGTGNFSIVNGGAVTVHADTASGLYAYGSVPLTISNSGAITSTGVSSASGIYVDEGDSASITNSAKITAVSGGTTSGIYAVPFNGANPFTDTVTNSGAILATSTSASDSAFGIFVVGTGSVTINNSGTTQGINNSGGQGYGIYALSTNAPPPPPPSAPDVIEAGPPVPGNVVINNSGTATGTTMGIFLVGSGTVNNSGSASGGVFSIFTLTDSVVNLTKASPIVGLIKGGGDDTSNSLLNFNIVVRTNYAGAKASLDAAIASYEAAYAAADGDGNDVTSDTVLINSSDYKWQDFEFVEDNLVQGRLYATTPGYHSLGSALDNLSPGNPNGVLVLNSLDALPNSGVVNALSQISPQELELFRNVAFDNNTFNVAKINNHLANLRDGLTGFDSSQLTVNDPSMDGSLNQIKSHLLAWNPPADTGLISDSTDSMFGGVDMKDMKDMKSSEVNTMPDGRWSAFVSGDVILADLSNNTANLQNADYTTGDVMAGVDYRIDRHFTIGALFAYAHTDADLDSRGSSATVDSYSPGLYASYVDKGLYANALGTYGRNAYTEDRNINIPGIAGDDHGGTSGNQGTFNLTGGYEFQRGAFKFGPVATAEYVHLDIDSIQESGGPTALNINEQDQDSFRTLIGMEARYVTDVATPLGRMTLTPHVSASWQHEYLDDADEGITSQFNNAGGGSFTVPTTNPDRNSAFLDIGLDATVDKNVTVFIDYEAQAGQDNFSAQSAQGGVKVGF